MKTLVSLFISTLLIGNVIAQKKIDKVHFINLLNAGKYDQVFKEAMVIRKQPYGKNTTVDYLIAKSLCMKGYISQAQTWFNYIEKHYSLSVAQRNFIKQEKSSCSNTPASAIQNVTYINSAPLPTTLVRGKGGFTVDCYSTDRGSVDKMKSEKELEERLFDLNHKIDAVAKLRSFLSTEFTIDTSGRFIIISYKSPITSNDVQKVTQRLEDTYQFYLRNYSLKESDKLFTVYLVPDRAILKQTAALIHGITLPSNSIGYSSLTDLALLGIANPNSVGTLFHELFHLTCRTDVGDIPPWLDEGMACLYSVYEHRNGKLYGSNKTWRSNHFKTLSRLSSTKVPHLQELINMKWDEFEGGEYKNACAASVNYAYSNLFLLYLQDLNALPGLVTAYKNRLNTKTDSLDTGLDNISLLESTLKKSMTAISNEFYTWMKAVHSIDMKTLLQNRSSNSSFYLPTEFEEYITQINTLTAKPDIEAKLGAEKKSQIQQKINNLKQQYLQLSKNYYEGLNEQLYALTINPTDGMAKTNPSNLKSKERLLQEISEDLKEIKEDLEKKLKN